MKTRPHKQHRAAWKQIINAQTRHILSPYLLLKHAAEYIIMNGCQGGPLESSEAQTNKRISTVYIAKNENSL